RGINVSGQKKVPMAELRKVLTNSGFENVQTYIQSGNVIFKSSEENLQKLEQIISQAIKSCFGFEVPVLVVKPSSLEQIFNDCPFSKETKESSYFILLYNAPDKIFMEEASKLSYGNEEIFITNSCVYLHSSIG